MINFNNGKVITSSKVMDPWQEVQTKRDTYNNGCSEVDCIGDKLEFEDNFEPSDRLPDSAEYLAVLEAKLAKIRSDPNILQQLAAKREECMQALINSDSISDETLDLDTPIENSSILRTILPQRQALTQGELVELIQYDQLITESDNQTSEDSHSR